MKKIDISEYNELLAKYNTLNETHQNDRKFYIVALNISGQREKLENQAMQLIDEYNIIKALKILRGQNEM